MPSLCRRPSQEVLPLLAEVEKRIRQTWAASRPHHSPNLSRFEAEAQRAGATLQEVSDLQVAGVSVAALGKAGGVSLCQVADPDLAKESDLESALAEVGIGLVAGPSPEPILQAGIGVTRAVAGVAETGSILVYLDEVDGRLLTMLPEIHVAFLHRDAVVGSMEDGLLLTRYLALKSHAEKRPSYLSWVTGPSRTADIERVLTIGVHGPRELHIFLLPPTGKGYLP
ncbi:MAG: lactate utilization protein C [Candidatus Methylomirabilales bacterium]